VGKLLITSFLTDILFPNKCETCKCFEVISENDKNYKFHELCCHKYICTINEGDNYCDYMQERIDFIKGVEKVESIEDFEERKKYRMEYMKNKLKMD
jgi:hypothetical protein